MEVSGGSEASRADSAMPPRDAPWDGLLCCEARQVRKSSAQRIKTTWVLRIGPWSRSAERLTPPQKGSG